MSHPGSFLPGDAQGPYEIVDGPFFSISCSSPFSILTTLNGGAAWGYVDIPQVERAVVVNLCPQNAATWRNRPRPPSKACMTTAALAAKTYSAAGAFVAQKCHLWLNLAEMRDTDKVCFL